MCISHVCQVFLTSCKYPTGMRLLTFALSRPRAAPDRRSHSMRIARVITLLSLIISLGGCIALPGGSDGRSPDGGPRGPGGWNTPGRNESGGDDEMVDHRAGAWRLPCRRLSRYELRNAAGAVAHLCRPVRIMQSKSTYPGRPSPPSAYALTTRVSPYWGSRASAVSSTMASLSA